MRDYQKEFENRVQFIRDLLKKSGAKGIVYGNSGGKDSALVGILCKAACDNTVGIMMPCSVSRNFEIDMADGLAVAEQFHIEHRCINLSDTRDALTSALKEVTGDLQPASLNNIAPRLRMTTLYAIAANEGRLVAGTGNRSEAYVGYFTKWGDGAHDFNPISDLTVTEIFEFLRFLNAPESIITKAPSAGLAEGQTDEGEMGLTYAELDTYISGGTVAPEKAAKIDSMHKASQHKRDSIVQYCPLSE